MIFRKRQNALFPSLKPLLQSGLYPKGFEEWYTGLGAQKMIPKIFHESKKYKSIILPKNIYPCIRCISAALKTVKNALKLPHCILKTMLVQPHKRIHETAIDTFFLIYYFCNFSLCLNSINWSQQFADVHVTLKKTWGMCWDVRIKANFQTCTWLILRQF